MLQAPTRVRASLSLIVFTFAKYFGRGHRLIHMHGEYKTSWNGDANNQSALVRRRLRKSKAPLKAGPNTLGTHLPLHVMGNNKKSLCLVGSSTLHHPRGLRRPREAKSVSRYVFPSTRCKRHRSKAATHSRIVGKGITTNTATVSWDVPNIE